MRHELKPRESKARHHEGLNDVKGATEDLENTETDWVQLNTWLIDINNEIEQEAELGPLIPVRNIAAG